MNQFSGHKVKLLVVLVIVNKKLVGNHILAAIQQNALGRFTIPARAPRLRILTMIFSTRRLSAISGAASILQRSILRRALMR